MRLGEIADGLPLLPPPSSMAALGSAIKVVIGMGALLGWLWLMAQIYTEAPLDARALPLSVAAGVMVWAVCMSAAVPLLRGRANSLHLVTSLGVVSLALLCGTSVLAGRWINQAYDTSPALDHSTRIADKWRTTHKKSNRIDFHIDLAPWKSGGANVTLDVTEDFSENATVGSAMVVTTHVGKLGWEWIEKYELVPISGIPSR
jgi:hypothetical protein